MKGTYLCTSKIKNVSPGSIPKLKQSELIKDWENVTALFFFFLKKKRTKSGLDKLVWIFPIIAGVLGSAPEEFCNF